MTTPRLAATTIAVAMSISEHSLSAKTISCCALLIRLTMSVCALVAPSAPFAGGENRTHPLLHESASWNVAPSYACDLVGS